MEQAAVNACGFWEDDSLFGKWIVCGWSGVILVSCGGE